ncbi:pH-response regulator protein palA/rim20 [Ceratocystis pirilliformis]|uniref:PH-response regulator protein palA/rim20 n=1 Tax=Ceratocystis pirilliformis TaxID=259994 RepID=A0ABR3Z120_9PEZI
MTSNLSSPNALIVPFRVGATASYSDAICQYINTQYDQHPDMFRNDLQAIDTLRREAVTVREPHVSGITKLQAYAAQIVWIGGKFPIDIGVNFPWYPAFGCNSDRPVVRNNLKYELLNVLYNLAALYCHLADSTSRGTPEGLKTAASYFSQAAGVLAHMQTEILPGLRMSDPPEDMDDATLEALTQLCLAEAQECFWQKAVTDGYKDAIISKLAIRVSDLYGEAASASMKSNAISSQWIHHMSAKQHHFAAAAQYRMACDCLEKRRYGEEVARLKEALACVNDGLRETKSGYVSKTVTRDLSGLKGRIDEDLKRAEKDNDIIYLQPVPTRMELKPLDRVNMATLKCPREVSSPCNFLGEDSEFGPPLFSKLVPFAVHLAVSIYEGRRDRLVNNDIVQPLDRLSEALNATLDSLGLPGSLQALEKPLGLPPSLIQRAEEVRQANALHRVENSFRDIDKLVAADLKTFEEGKQILMREEEEDKRMRNTYRDMWTRPGSREDEQGKKLWTQMGEIDNYFKISLPSDKLVRSKYAMIKPQLQLLSGSDRALLDYVPSSRRTDVPEGLRTVLARLRSTYNDVQRLQSRRRKKIDMIREKARSDNVRSAISREATRLERAYPGVSLDAASFDEWLESRLDTMYEAELAALAADEDEQNHVLGELSRVHREFESQKRVVGDRGGREREEVLQKLNMAYDKYKELLENAEDGRKFYNDLSKIVGARFRDCAKAWANNRRLDAQSLEE